MIKKISLPLLTSLLLANCEFANKNKDSEVFEYVDVCIEGVVYISPAGEFHPTVKFSREGKLTLCEDKPNPQPAK